MLADVMLPLALLPCIFRLHVVLPELPATFTTGTPSVCAADGPSALSINGNTKNESTERITALCAALSARAMLAVWISGQAK
jgi:hypothetical protein